MSCGGELAFLTDDDRDLEAHPEYGFCCYGTAMFDADGCTCWSPVFTLDQQESPAALSIETRSVMCDDCAYRPGSEERTEGSEHENPDLLGLPNFWCHQGLRAVREWRHPDGRVRPGEPLRDYDPPTATVDGEPVPLKASGAPADRCAGWAAHNRTEVPA